MDVCHLQTFGKRGVVHDAKTIKNKLDNHRETCIFVGYADDHAGNVYRMFNPQTKQIWVTRDVRWIKSSPTLEMKTPVETETTVETVPDKYDDNEGIAPSDHGTPAVANNTPMVTIINAAATATVKQAHVCVLREMKQLGGWFNPTTLQYIAQSNKNGKLEVINEEIDEADDPDDATACRVGREVANATLSHAVSEFAFYSAAKVIAKQAAANGEDHHLCSPRTFVKRSTTRTPPNVRNGARPSIRNLVT